MNARCFIRNRARLFMFLLLSVCAAAAAVVADVGDPPLSPLRVEGRRIVDERGATVILRGVAVNQLGGYFQANPSVPSTVPLSRQDFERMAALGVNSVRLIVTWDLIEPERGLRDEAYLDRVKEAVGWARENNIYVILDMHQDAWGQYIATMPDENCAWPSAHNIGWDGAPEWATLADGKSNCMIGHREFSPSVYTAWQSFWEDREGIQGQLIESWAWLAAAFKDDPTVAGYDLLNEPNWGYNPSEVKRKYKPIFYRRCLEAIREAEEGGLNKIIFFEPLAIWSAIPREKPVRFTDDPNIVYAPHIYLGSISIDMFLFNRELLPLRKGFELARDEAAVYNTTFWNGEWMPGPGDHAWRYAALEDEFQVGGARWIWKSSCGDPHQMASVWPDREAVVEGENGAVVVFGCGDPDEPGGVDMGINPIDAVILSRPYPRAFPSPAVFTSDPKTRKLVMNGDAPTGDVPLEAWIPGEGEPEVEYEGTSAPELVKVPGGWVMRSLPGPGAWRLRAKGSDL